MGHGRPAGRIVREIREELVRGLSPLTGGAGRVDRTQAGLIIIRGVKVVGKSSPNRHGIQGVEGTDYEESALQESLRLYDGLKVNVNHPPRNTPNAERASEDRLGKLLSPRVLEGETYADLAMLVTHPMAERLANAAEAMPDAFALSHNARGVGTIIDGRYVISEIPEVRSVDVVADGGTCISLFESAEARMDEQLLDAVMLQEGFTGVVAKDGSSRLYIDGELIEAGPRTAAQIAGQKKAAQASAAKRKGKGKVKPTAGVKNRVAKVVKAAPKAKGPAKAKSATKPKKATKPKAEPEAKPKKKSTKVDATGAGKSKAKKPAAKKGGAKKSRKSSGGASTSTSAKGGKGPPLDSKGMPRLRKTEKSTSHTRKGDESQWGSTHRAGDVSTEKTHKRTGAEQGAKRTGAEQSASRTGAAQGAKRTGAERKAKGGAERVAGRKEEMRFSPESRRFRRGRGRPLFESAARQAQALLSQDSPWQLNGGTQGGQHMPNKNLRQALLEAGYDVEDASAMEDDEEMEETAPTSQGHIADALQAICSDESLTAEQIREKTKHLLNALDAGDDIEEDDGEEEEDVEEDNEEEAGIEDVEESDDEEDDGEENVEESEEDDDDREESDAKESLAREVRALKAKDAVRDLCESLSFAPSKVQLKALLALDSEADRKAMIQELRGNRSAPRSGAPGAFGSSVQESREMPKTAKDQASLLLR